MSPVGGGLKVLEGGGGGEGGGYISLSRYSKTSLIQHALGERFCVGIDRVLVYTVPNTDKWSNKNEN